MNVLSHARQESDSTTGGGPDKIGIPLAAALAKIEEALAAEGYALDDPVVPASFVLWGCSVTPIGGLDAAGGGAEAGGTGRRLDWEEGVSLVAWVLSMAVELVRRGVSVMGGVGADGGSSGKGWESSDDGAIACDCSGSVSTVA